MKLQVKLFGLVAALGILAACSGAPNLSNNVPGVPSDSPTSFSQSQASANKSALVGAINQIAVGLTGDFGPSSASPTEAAAALVEKEYPTVAKDLRRVQLTGGSLRIQGTANCEQGGTVTFPDDGDIVDNDGDGIPVYAEIRYNNCKEDGVTANGLLLGMQDKNDSNPAGGFTFLIDLSLTDGTDTARLALGIDYTPGAGGAYNVRYGYLIQENDDKLAFGVNMSYTPKSDGNSDPYDAGFVNFTGRFVYKLDGENYVLDMKGENLEHSSSCTSTFVSGKATFQDNAGNKLVIQYTGCNSYTVTYNGNPI
ncbi:hypothetical protein Mterra_00814 [Calidithermus terrae]|uniref:Lipoprotein n=1 Tax=Calidithermus terrae TaxID=1408545 RepID=A0A399EZP4_9DEIN|nr:hypothetical protein [Calidithermus terrae]RIH89233.1 hypothetical protein Mterra_00814 [Calidithermus terrae]